MGGISNLGTLFGMGEALSECSGFGTNDGDESGCRFHVESVFVGHLPVLGL